MNAPQVMEHLQLPLNDWLNAKPTTLQPYQDWRKPMLAAIKELEVEQGGKPQIGDNVIINEQTRTITPERVWGVVGNIPNNPGYGASLELDAAQRPDLVKQAQELQAQGYTDVTPGKLLLKEASDDYALNSKWQTASGKSDSRGYMDADYNAAQNLVDDVALKLVGGDEAFTEEAMLTNNPLVVDYINGRALTANIPQKVKKAPGVQYAGQPIGKSHSNNKGETVVDLSTGNIYYDEKNNISLWEVEDAGTKQRYYVNIPQTQAYSLYKNIAPGMGVTDRALETYLIDSQVFDKSGNITRPDRVAKGRWQYSPQQSATPAQPSTGTPKVNVLPSKQGAPKVNILAK
jgi:hypothetical protein